MCRPVCVREYGTASVGVNRYLCAALASAFAAGMAVTWLVCAALCCACLRPGMAARWCLFVCACAMPRQLHATGTQPRGRVPAACGNTYVRSVTAHGSMMMMMHGSVAAASGGLRHNGVVASEHIGWNTTRHGHTGGMGAHTCRCVCDVCNAVRAMGRTVSGLLTCTCCVSMLCSECIMAKGRSANPYYHHVMYGWYA